MIETTVYFLLGILFIGWQVIIDAEHLKDKDYIENHISRWNLRLVYFLTVMFISVRFSIAFSFLFMALFDQILNIVMGYKFWHLGSTAKWDIFWKKRITFYKVFKIIALLISLYLYYGQHIHQLI